MTKLIHGLANTNHQNHLYYNTIKSCPICEAAEETFEHVLTCQHPAARIHREQCLQQLEKDLQQANTPGMVVHTILHGFSEWLHPAGQPTQSQTLTAGSLHGSLRAYTEQFHNLGWYHFCLGRISKKWYQAVTIYMKEENGKRFNQDSWASMLITCLWRFAKQMWAHKNQVVHGQTAEEQAGIFLR